MAIGAVNNCGRRPWYSEACPGTIAVTYSSGDRSGMIDKQISTTDLHHKCTKEHTGTSAAAPIAAGIILFKHQLSEAETEVYQDTGRSSQCILIK